LWFYHLLDWNILLHNSKEKSKQRIILFAFITEVVKAPPIKVELFILGFIFNLKLNFKNFNLSDAIKIHQISYAINNELNFYSLIIV